MGDVGQVAVTALLLAAGCEPEHLDETARALGHDPIGDTHEERYRQVTKAIEKVRKKHS